MSKLARLKLRGKDDTRFWTENGRIYFQDGDNAGQRWSVLDPSDDRNGVPSQHSCWFSVVLGSDTTADSVKKVRKIREAVKRLGREW